MLGSQFTGIHGLKIAQVCIEILKFKTKSPNGEHFSDVSTLQNNIYRSNEDSSSPQIPTCNKKNSVQFSAIIRIAFGNEVKLK